MKGVFASPASQSAKGPPRKMTDRLKGMVSVLKDIRRRPDGGHAETTYVVEGQKPIHNVEELLYDCEEFLSVVSKIGKAASKVNTTKRKFQIPMSNSINKWRVKKKGHKVFVEYDGLLARGVAAEQDLKKLIDESLNDCSSLILQSEHMQPRLFACIKYNEEKLESLQPIVSDSRSLLEDLKKERKVVSCMVDFYDEVSRLKANQVIPYIPWELRAVEPAVVEVPLKRVVLERRMGKLSQAVMIVETLLQFEVPKFNKTKENLQHCMRSRSALCNLCSKLSYYRSMVTGTGDSSQRGGSFGETAASEEKKPARKESSSSLLDGSHGASVLAHTQSERRSSRSMSNSSNRDRSLSEAFNPERALDEVLAMASLTSQEPQEATPPSFYDHSQCSDCALVYVMANECAMHLAASQHFAQEGSAWLQKLYQIREQLNEVMHQLEDIDLDGDHPFLHHHE